MKHKTDEFINNMRKDLRLFSKVYDEQEIANLPEESKEIEKMKFSVDEKKNNLVINCQNAYSELYHGLLHVKFLRLYIEATLKYGMADYYSCVLFPQYGKETKVVSTLIKAFNDTGK
jgi:hypothetical protein